MKITFCCMICGFEIQADTSMSKIRCNCCKAEIAVPYRPAEKRYDEVTSYRREGNFQMGRAICEEILREYSKDVEAHFGRLLCRYGI